MGLCDHLMHHNAFNESFHTVDPNEKKQDKVTVHFFKRVHDVLCVLSRVGISVEFHL